MFFYEGRGLIKGFCQGKIPFYIIAFVHFSHITISQIFIFSRYDSVSALVLAFVQLAIHF